MAKGIILAVLISTVLIMTGFAQEKYQKDVIPTASGDLEITFIGHGTLMFTFGGKVVHVDPVSVEGDYSQLPKADLILVTHEHGDHLDAEAIAAIRKGGTEIILTQTCAEKVEGTVMANGDVSTVAGFKVEAYPAYNLVHKRDNGQFYHPQGVGNSYVITFGDKRVYVGGDTENTPEMKALKNIDVAFLPMNLPYTMSPEMVADAAKAFRPKILYPYHYGDTDTSEIVNLLQGEQGIEVRIREMN
jgi:L-ascorbate metabolism protein UlaG (beta-lactamase superfamily)